MAKYLYSIGAVLVLLGVYLFVTHISVGLARTFVAGGVGLEFLAAFVLIRRFIRKKAI